MTGTPSEFVLVVDDEPGIRDVLARGVWESGFQCAVVANAEEALARLRQGRYSVMLSDIRMPGMDGLELLKQAQALDPDMMVIMVTALAGVQTALQAIRAGAFDYITKPFQMAEVELQVHRALHVRRLRMENRAHARRLEELVQGRTRAVVDGDTQVVESLVAALAVRDARLRTHAERVARLGGALAKEMGLLPEQCEDVKTAGLLLDIGLIGVPDAVLEQDGALTPEATRVYRRHVEAGEQVLQPLVGLSRLRPLQRHHHERWDGGGYPDGLSGEAIPLGAQVLALADAFVTAWERPAFGRAPARGRVLADLQAEAGRLASPQLVTALLTLERSGALNEFSAPAPAAEPRIAALATARRTFSFPRSTAAM